MSYRRQEFSAKIRIAAYTRSGGHCENAFCQIVLQPGRIQYDHVIPAELGGEPTLANCQVLCAQCHKEKTSNDQGDIAKAKRRELKHAGIKKPRSITRWRKFNGDKVEAPRER